MVLLVLDAKKDIKYLRSQIQIFIKKNKNKKVIAVINKKDLLKPNHKKISKALYISAKNNNINNLIKKIIKITSTTTQHSSSIIVTNSRHFEALSKSKNALKKVKKDINKSISADLLALDIRIALNHLGEITGQITTDNLLDNIFKNFCIGK